MATLTKEQIEAKKRQLQQLKNEMKALYDELVEAGAIELSDDDLDKAAGGHIWISSNSKTPTEVVM
ncbi:MAG: hypothetical protein J5486_04710 [Bacteroidaceae bacterium]|nr:hypothetical protein [Bacteroidaceae bacterium]